MINDYYVFRHKASKVSSTVKPLSLEVGAGAEDWEASSPRERKGSPGSRGSTLGTAPCRTSNPPPRPPPLGELPQFCAICSLGFLGATKFACPAFPLAQELHSSDWHMTSKNLVLAKWDVGRSFLCVISGD